MGIYDLFLELVNLPDFIALAGLFDEFRLMGGYVSINRFVTEGSTAAQYPFIVMVYDNDDKGTALLTYAAASSYRRSTTIRPNSHRIANFNWTCYGEGTAAPTWYDMFVSPADNPSSIKTYSNTGNPSFNYLAIINHYYIECRSRR